MSEIWLPIPNYVGLYEASNTGFIRSLITNRILSATVNNAGYRTLKLCNKGMIKNHDVHRLILLTFSPSESNLYVNHKDGDKLNNCLDNLEWVTQKDNVSHAAQKRKHGFLAHKSVFNESQVLAIYNRLLKGERVKELCTEYGVSRHTISDIKAKNFWSYLLRDLPEIPRRKYK